MTPELTLVPITVDQARELLAGVVPSSWQPVTGFPAPGDLRAVSMLVATAEAPGAPVPAELVRYGPFRLVRTEDGATVGMAGFHGPPDADGVAEIGYGIAPGARRRGYAVAAALALKELAPLLGATTLMARTEPDHIASRRVMERIGLQLVRVDATEVEYRAVLPGAGTLST